MREEPPLGPLSGLDPAWRRFRASTRQSRPGAPCSAVHALQPSQPNLGLLELFAFPLSAHSFLTAPTFDCFFSLSFAVRLHASLKVSSLFALLRVCQ